MGDYKRSSKSKPVKGNRTSEYSYHNMGIKTSGNISPFMIEPDMVNYRVQSELLSLNKQALVRNKCIDKIVEQGQTVSNYFEAIYERREALALAASAARKLLDFLRNFKKPKYWKKLGKRKPKDLPEAWITYNFGIKPLIGTINDAMNILGKPYPTVTLRGGSGCRIDALYKDQGSYTLIRHFAKGSYFHQIRAHVSPNTNPNAALANIVGLSTPFSTAFSVVPWGWAVDYFVNASQMMSNFEDRFPGLKILSVWESISYKCELLGSRWEYNARKYTGQYSGSSYFFVRRPTNLKYSLAFDAPLLGGSKFANLMSAISLTLLGKRK